MHTHTTLISALLLACGAVSSLCLALISFMSGHSFQ